MGTIDVWAQITSERMAQRPWMQTLLRWTKQDDRPLHTPQTTIEAMDAAGVEIPLLSAWHGPERDLITNDEVARQIDAAPERFRGLATVDLERPMDCVREIRRLVDGRTFVGVRIVPWLWGLPPNDRRYYPIYAACIDAGVPFCTQIGHTGPLCRSETGRMIPYLEEVMLDVLYELPGRTDVGTFRLTVDMIEGRDPVWQDPDDDGSKKPKAEKKPAAKPPRYRVGSPLGPGSHHARSSRTSQPKTTSSWPTTPIGSIGS